LPGSPIINSLILKGEFPADYDYSKINLQMVTYAPKGMTLKELDRLRRWAVWKMNTRPRLIRHYLRPDLFGRSLVSFLRIYTPNWLLPKEWRRL